MKDLVEEFLLNNWTTYGIVELKQLQHDRDEKEEAERLDALTRILMTGNSVALEEAQRMLAEWLKRSTNEKHFLVRTLRLRRVFILKKLNDFDKAITECKKLLAETPESPTLHCLLGDLYGWLKTTDAWMTAIDCFDKADEIADGWWEPRLERLDKMFLLGVNNHDYWKEIVERTERWLHRQDAKTNRETLILITYNAVAAALVDPAYIRTDHYGKQRFEANRVQIPANQREDWNVGDIFFIAVQNRYPGDDDPAPSVRAELRDFLGEVQQKLIPGLTWNDR